MSEGRQLMDPPQAFLENFLLGSTLSVCASVAFGSVSSVKGVCLIGSSVSAAELAHISASLGCRVGSTFSSGGSASLGQALSAFSSGLFDGDFSVNKDTRLASSISV
jgi:hypothetical protein